MTDKTIAELREWKKQYDIFPSMAADKEFIEILSHAVPVKEVEPLDGRIAEIDEICCRAIKGSGDMKERELAIKILGITSFNNKSKSVESLEELAKRKGIRLGLIRGNFSEINVYKDWSLARAYLENLEDKGEGK